MNKVEFEYTVKKQIEYFEKLFFKEHKFTQYYLEELMNGKQLEDNKYYKKLSISSFAKVNKDFIQSKEYDTKETIVLFEKLIIFFKEHQAKLKEILKGIDKNKPDYDFVSEFIIKDVIDNINQVIEYIAEEKSIILNTKKEIANDVKSNASNGLQTKILWNNDIKELAYIFYCLKNENIIDINNLGATLSKIFADSSKNEIKNDTFNNYFADFRKSDYPAKAWDIDKLIKAIKKAK